MTNLLHFDQPSGERVWVMRIISDHETVYYVVSSGNPDRPDTITNIGRLLNDAPEVFPDIVWNNPQAIIFVVPGHSMLDLGTEQAKQAGVLTFTYNQLAELAVTIHTVIERELDIAELTIDDVYIIPGTAPRTERAVIFSTKLLKTSERQCHIESSADVPVSFGNSIENELVQRYVTLVSVPSTIQRQFGLTASTGVFAGFNVKPLRPLKCPSIKPNPDRKVLTAGYPLFRIPFELELPRPPRRLEFREDGKPLHPAPLPPPTGKSKGVATVYKKIDPDSMTKFQLCKDGVKLYHSKSCDFVFDDPMCRKSDTNGVVDWKLQTLKTCTELREAVSARCFHSLDRGHFLAIDNLKNGVMSCLNAKVSRLSGERVRRYPRSYIQPSHSGSRI